MNKNYIMIILTFLIFTFNVEAISAELIFSGNKSMKVTNLERVKTSEKDSLKMVRNGMPVGIRVSSVEKINFDVQLEIEKLIELKEDREYSLLINKLNSSLQPYESFEGIPSNLTKFKSLLIELYFLEKNYDKVIALANNIIENSEDESLKSSAQIFLAPKIAPSIY